MRLRRLYAHHALCGTGYSQEDHQLLRSPSGRYDSAGRHLSGHYQVLDEWLSQVPRPWIAGMEATMFTGWVYDHLRGTPTK